MGRRRQPTTEYLAECLWPGVTETDVRELDVRVQASAAASRDTNTRVRYLGALLVAGTAIVCADEGGDRSSREAITMPTNSDATMVSRK